MGVNKSGKRQEAISKKDQKLLDLKDPVCSL